jgi:hypothetical protein
LQQALRGVQVPPAGGGALDPRQQEIDKEAAKRKESAQASLNVVDNTLKQIDKALSQVGTFTTGVPGQVLGRIAGTPAFNLRATAQTIKANLGFDRLQVMRDASPTGGALGQVAIQELEALQSSIGNLDPAQSPEQLIENLKAVQGHYQRWRGTLQGKAGADGTTDAGPDDELKALRRKYGLN